jgi:hypothetical protein
MNLESLFTPEPQLLTFTYEGHSLSYYACTSACTDYDLTGLIPWPASLDLA